MTASRYLDGQQWVPGVGQNQVRSLSLPGATQDIAQHENNCELAKYKCYFQCNGRLINRGYSAEEKLGSCGIWTRQVPAILRVRPWLLQPRNSTIPRITKIGIVAS